MTPSPESKTTPVVRPVAYLSPSQHPFTSANEAWGPPHPWKGPWTFALSGLKKEPEEFLKGTVTGGLFLWATLTKAGG